MNRSRRDLQYDKYVQPRDVWDGTTSPPKDPRLFEQPRIQPKVASAPAGLFTRRITFWVGFSAFVISGLTLAAVATNSGKVSAVKTARLGKPIPKSITAELDVLFNELAILGAELGSDLKELDALNAGLDADMEKLEAELKKFQADFKVPDRKRARVGSVPSNNNTTP